MTDNVTTQTSQLSTVPDGTVIATDQLADGSHAQLIKIIDGTANGTTAATVNATGLKVDASGAAVPITDNSGSLTVDNSGTFPVQATQSGVWNVTTLTGITNVVHVDDNAGSLTVDGTVAASNFPATVDTNSGNKSASTLRVVLATDQPALTNKLLVTPDANSAVNVAQMNGVTVTMGNGVAGTGVQRVAIASDNTAFTVNAAQSGTWTVQPGNTANTTPWLIQDSPATSGGITYSFNAIKATATSIKGSAGQVYGWYIYNDNTAVSYVQFFNTASGSVTLGATTPVYSLGIPASSGANVFIPHGIAHSTAITIAATTTATGSTNPTNNVVINVFYK